eukprot:364111-Chlamydomonas_euryale.AAC.22
MGQQQAVRFCATASCILKPHSSASMCNLDCRRLRRRGCESSMRLALPKCTRSRLRCGCG